jgi:Zn-dependent M28 family amino/carboxypeptidase
MFRRKGPLAAGAILLMFLPLVSAFGYPRPDNSVVLSKPEDIKAEFSNLQCQNEKRGPAVKALFMKMGAADADIKSETRDSVENIIVRKAGTSPETIIIGAHYDKTPEGCGAIDNWSGVVALAHVYRSLRNISTRKTILFVAFGRKEEGLIGSRSMAGALSKEQAAQVCAMINLDSFGIGTPQAAANYSSKKLLDLGASIAKRMQMPFGQGIMDRYELDTIPFTAEKIPTIALHGLAGNYPGTLHTDNDKATKVDTFNVYLGYRLALGMVIEIINAPCDSWR